VLTPPKAKLLDARDFDLPCLQRRRVADHGAPLVGFLQIGVGAMNPSRIIYRVRIVFRWAPQEPHGVPHVSLETRHQGIGRR